MTNIEKIINDLENLKIEHFAIQDAIDLILEMESEIEDLKDDLEQISEQFEEYKTYGRCVDYGDY